MAAGHSQAKLTSPWLDSTKATLRFPALSGRVEADVIVAGAGMAGVMAAWRLAEKGKSVVLLEKNHIASGETGYTTAFATRVPDADLPALERKYGPGFVPALFEANARAQEYLYGLIEREKIGCWFGKCDSYHYSSSENDPMLAAEWKVARNADKKAEFVRGAGAASAGKFVSEAIRFGNEARFDARKFILGLLSRKTAGSIRAFEESEVAGVSVDGRVIAKTGGGEAEAEKIVIATGMPMQQFALEKEIVPSTTFVVAAEYEGEPPISDGLFWDTSEPYFYFRRLGRKGIMLGGADVSQGPFRAQERHAVLESFLEKYAPGKYHIAYRWAGRIYSSQDGLPYACAHPKHPDRVFAATAFGGNGMVMGVAAALVLADLACGEENEYAALFSLSGRRGASE